AVFEGSHDKVVEHENIDSGEFQQHPADAAVHMGDRELPKQLRCSFVQDGETVSARLVCQGAGKPTFADTSWADEEDVLILAHPFTGGERTQQLAVEPAWMLVIDVFDDSAFFQLGRLQASCQRTILSPKPLLIDEHREA